MKKKLQISTKTEKSEENILPPITIEARSYSLNQQYTQTNHKNAILKQDRNLANIFSSKRSQHILNLQRKKIMLNNQLKIVNKTQLNLDSLSEILYFKNRIITRQLKLL